MHWSKHAFHPVPVKELGGILAQWGRETNLQYIPRNMQGFCFAVLCSGYTLTDFPISIRLTSLALWQSNDCPSASKATLMNMDKCFMWFHYERLHNHNKVKHNNTVCIFLGIYCRSQWNGPLPEQILSYWTKINKIQWNFETSPGNLRPICFDLNVLIETKIQNNRIR